MSTLLSKNLKFTVNQRDRNLINFKVSIFFLRWSIDPRNLGYHGKVNTFVESAKDNKMT
eukprot:UN01617